MKSNKQGIREWRTCKTNLQRPYEFRVRTLTFTLNEIGSQWKVTVIEET